MVYVEVTDEDLVQEVVGDLLRCNPLVTATANVEEKLVAVAQLDQPASGRLLGPSAGHARAQGHDPHLVAGQRLCAGIVDVPISFIGLTGEILAFAAWASGVSCKILCHHCHHRISFHVNSYQSYCNDSHDCQ